MNSDSAHHELRSDRIVLSRITSYCIWQKKKRATIKTNLVQMINDICKTTTFSVFVRDKWNVNSKYSESYNTASHIWYLPLLLWYLEVECTIILQVEDNYWFKKGQLQLLTDWLEVQTQLIRCLHFIMRRCVIRVL